MTAPERVPPASSRICALCRRRPILHVFLWPDAALGIDGLCGECSHLFDKPVPQEAAGR